MTERNLERPTEAQDDWDDWDEYEEDGPMDLEDQLDKALDKALPPRASALWVSHGGQ